MSFYHTKILGSGHYVPSQIMTNDDIAKRVETNNEWIMERTGIRERRIADPVKDVPSGMAEQAAKMAIKNAGINPNDIELILFSVTIPDFFFPNTASVLQEKLGITNQCACLDISAACTGYVYGLTIADAFIKTGTYKNILLIGCEMTSRFNNWEDRNTCILFGDGCGATVLTRAESHETSTILSTALASDSTKKDALILKCGGSVRPVDQRVLDERAQYVTMDGQQVFKAAVKTRATLCEQVIAKANLKTQDISWFVPHQANLRIIEAVGNRFEFPKEKVIVNVDRYANTSSASIPIAMSEAIQENKIQRGQYILFAAFGAGLTSGAILLRY
jgi:3-oxoacyl-[acyl-carrier-protein] synthase-3